MTLTDPAERKEQRILLIEDDPDDVLLIELALRQSGLLFRTQRVDTQDALQQALRTPPDLILCDYRLPQWSGLEALHLAREICPEIPFIFVTGSDDANSVAEMVTHGASAFLPKDQLGKLGATVQAALHPSGKKSLPDLAGRPRTETGPAPRTAALEAGMARCTVELETARKDLETLSYAVSHDLRAPLRHIHNFVQILAQDAGGKLNDEERQLLGFITRAAERMGRMIDDLLAFSHLGLATPKQRRFPLAETVRAAMQHLDPTARGTATWTIGDLPEVEADPVLLQQVMTNLLSNALKYSRPRAQPAVEVTATTTPEETIVRVRDNGVGFDMRYVDKLFNVFQRLHRESDFEGTGIGLANVRRVIQRHGGRTWAEGEPGAGATFYFSLPLHPSASSPS